MNRREFLGSTILGMVAGWLGLRQNAAPAVLKTEWSCDTNKIRMLWKEKGLSVSEASIIRRISDCDHVIEDVRVVGRWVSVPDVNHVKNAVNEIHPIPNGYKRIMADFELNSWDNSYRHMLRHAEMHQLN